MDWIYHIKSLLYYRWPSKKNSKVRNIKGQGKGHGRGNRVCLLRKSDQRVQEEGAQSQWSRHLSIRVDQQVPDWLWKERTVPERLHRQSWPRRTEEVADQIRGVFGSTDLQVQGCIRPNMLLSGHGLKSERCYLDGGWRTRHQSVSRLTESRRREKHQRFYPEAHSAPSWVKNSNFWNEWAKMWRRLWEIQNL